MRPRPTPRATSASTGQSTSGQDEDEEDTSVLAFDLLTVFRVCFATRYVSWQDETDAEDTGRAWSLQMRMVKPGVREQHGPDPNNADPNPNPNPNPNSNPNSNPNPKRYTELVLAGSFEPRAWRRFWMALLLDGARASANLPVRGRCACVKLRGRVPLFYPWRVHEVYEGNIRLPRHTAFAPLACSFICTGFVLKMFQLAEYRMLGRGLGKTHSASGELRIRRAAC